MPRLQYAGGLWGFVVQTDEGEKMLCRTCYQEAKQKAQVKKVIEACGRGDLDEESEDFIVYLCESDGCISDSAPYAG